MSIVNEFDSLYERLKASRKRQAEVLATTDRELSALDRLMGKTVQNDIEDVKAPKAR